jgi:drug/metabolite transporter (DMT)-like permease
MRAGLRHMLLSAFAFSVMGALVKLGARALPTQEIVLARSVVTLVLSYALVRRAGVSPWGQRPLLLLVRGVVGFIALSCVFAALARLPLAEATVIQYLYPIFVAVLATTALREKVTWALVVAIGLSTVGVFIVSRPGLVTEARAQLDSAGMLMALLGALFTAVAYVLVRRLSRHEHPIVIVFYFPLVSLPLSAFALLDDLVWPRGLQWLILAGIGAFTQIGQVALTRGLAALPAATASTVSYSQIVFAAGWGALLFDEWPDAWTACGSACILVATLVVARYGRIAESVLPNTRESADRAAQ